MIYEHKLKQCVDEDGIKKDEPMSRHTSFKVGGLADYFITPKNKEELSKLVKICNKEGLKYCILGNGSNLLVSDKGYRGIIIHLGSHFSNVDIKDDIIIAGSGILLGKLALKASASSLSGLEFAAGIPGSLGGAVFMNAGAYDGEISDILISVTAMTTNGDIVVFERDELKFGYRYSIFQDNNYIVLEVKIKLSHGKKELIEAKIKDFNNRRRDKQPLEFPSAGSTFKRPEGYFAAKLIETVGLKGFKLGGAMVSDKHCGFVINKDKASALDIYNICKHVKKEVYEKLGVNLELEVGLLGEFE
jgi:UDP-N-acetylenolpyruvoylglucosamine reductase